MADTHVRVADDCVLSDIDQLFQKKRQIRFRHDKFKLPSSDTFYTEPIWQVPDLQNLKSSLNDVKGLLNEMELVSWHQHTRAMNNATLIIGALRDQFNPEFCTGAWCKFTECLHSYRVVPAVAVDLYFEGLLSEINSVHICEVPGAFISATNHFLVQKIPHVKWNWVATSLNPYFEGNDVGEMINEDKLILHSWKNWTFLKDGSGNVLLENNIRHFTDNEIKDRKLHTVHFVTADGSIDCQHNPAEQENLVVNLHLAEIITALRILSPGGSFVLKIFTFLECHTICHLYLLACTFREVHLFKPVTSKEGNSEVYVICTGYFGLDNFKREIDLLLSTIENSEKRGKNGLFSLSNVDPEFLSRIIAAAEFFTKSQMSVITRNVSAFPPSIDCYGKIRDLQMDVLKKYMQKFPLIQLRNQDTLFKGMRYKHGTIASAHVNCLAAAKYTTQERIDQPNQDFEKQLGWIGKNLGFHSFTGSVSRQVDAPIQLELPKYNGPHCFRFGRPYTNILSSRFCNSRLLNFRQQLRQLFSANQQNASVKLFDNHSCNDTELKTRLVEIISTLVSGLDLEEIHQKTHIHCFHVTPNDCFRQNDIDVTRENISRFINILRGLEVGDSVFLCEFPLLSRLHVGIIVLITKIFVKVWILMHSTSFHGIFLFGFQGFKTEKLLKEKLFSLPRLWTSAQANAMESILEVVEMHRLCVSTNRQWKRIATYNALRLVHSLQSFIDGVKGSSVLQSE